MARAYAFRWNAWNLDKIDMHGVDVDEAEYVVNNSRPPYPARADGDKFVVRGSTVSGVWIQVVYTIDEDDERVFVIHARPLNADEARTARAAIAARRFK